MQQLFEQYSSTQVNNHHSCSNSDLLLSLPSPQSTVMPKSYACVTPSTLLSSQSALCYTPQTLRLLSPLSSPIPLEDQQQKTKRITKKRKDQKQYPPREVSIRSLILPSSSRSFHVYSDIMINQNHELNLGGATSWGSIGSEFMRGTKFTKREDSVEVQLEFKEVLARMNVDDVLAELSRTPSPFHQKFRDALQVFHGFHEVKRKEAIQSRMPLEKQDEQYEAFCAKSLQQVQEFAKTEGLYGYAIGRNNYFNGQIEMKNLGYSKGLLSILCLNNDVFQQICMRNKPIDMFLDQQHVQELSLKHIQSRANEEFSFDARLYLKTIDGYNLSVNQTLHKWIDVHEKGRDHAFFLYISKFDIDLHELEGLIEYRKSLANSKGISFDRLIQAELSVLLEDVEYSVQSQLFMEKHYRESAEAIAKMKEERFPVEEDQEKLKKSCGYRYLHQQSVN